jgi:hypothetical protein
MIQNLLPSSSRIKALSLRTVLNNIVNNTITGVNSDNQKVIILNDYAIAIQGTSVGLSRVYPNSTVANLRISISDENDVVIAKNDTNGDLISQFRMDNDGKMYFIGLPASDPNNLNEIYKENGFIKVSE